MKVLGLDPGMLRLGWGAVRIKKDELKLELYGLIHNPRGAEEHNLYLNTAIQRIVREFPAILNKVNPDIVVAEIVPSGLLGSNSELNVAAITVCKVIALQRGLPWHEFGANTVKKHMVGDGKASKARIRNAVIETFPILGDEHKALKQQQKENGEKVIGLHQDVFDGVAIAITGANKYG